MPFVVKITNRTSHDFWLSPADTDGARSIATRENADTFQTYEDANVASRRLLETFRRYVFMFSVESAD
jgi:hypothetical protein